jgi:hypothetical protein
MNWFIKSKFIMVFFLAIAVSILSLGTTGIVMALNHSPEPVANSGYNTQDVEKTLSEKGFITVKTLEEASMLVGYPVAQPTLLPEGFTDEGNPAKIVVVQYKFSTERRVMQTWVSKDGSASFLLVNDPGCRGIGGEETLVAGTQGERAFYGTDAKRSKPLLALFWEGDNNIAFNLVAFMAGPLNEKEMYQIAESVRVK